MNFTSISAMKGYILNAMQKAVAMAEDYVYDVLMDFLDIYYSEYSPDVYERTYQMLSSLVRSGVHSTGEGFIAEVWFDAGMLDYTVKSMTKWPTGGGYMNPYNGAISSDGVFVNPHGSGYESLSSAMHGLHGGKVPGIAIWDRSVEIFDATLIDKLVEYLVAAGVPIG